MKVLVTGSSGFLGSHLMTTILGDIYGVDIDTCVSETIHKADVTEAGAMMNIGDIIQPNIIIHAAAQPYINRSFVDPSYDAKLNIVGTINMIRMAKEHKAKLIFISSAAVYGDADKTVVNEDIYKEPLSPYGLGKLCAETYVKLLYPESAILRLSSLYGIQRGLRHGPVNKLIETIIKTGKCWVTGDGKQTRDLIHVSDVCSAIQHVINNDISGIYNIGTGREISMLDVLGAIRTVSGLNPNVEYKPTPAGDILRNCLDIKRIKETGWVPMYHLENSIGEIIKHEEECNNESATCQGSCSRCGDN